MNLLLVMSTISCKSLRLSLSIALHVLTTVQIKSSGDSDQYQALICNNCQQYIGHLDQQAGGYRLYKWRLQSLPLPSEQNTGQPRIYQPSMSSTITTQFQSIMLAQCTSKLLLLPMHWKALPSHSLVSPNPEQDTATKILSLWVLSPSLRYSSTATEGESQQISNGHSSAASGKLAMKIFWKTVSAATAESMMEGNKAEEVFLPPQTILEIEELLWTSAFFLPPSGRKFQDWDVGLLERFEER